MTPLDLKRAPAHLATARLDLHLPRPEHAEPLRESIHVSLAALRYIDWARAPFSADEARRFCERDAQKVAAGECLIYFAFERASGAFVGSLDLHSFHPDAPRCQIGYVGDTRHAGRGLMREAALALVDLAFELGVVRVEAWCDARNTRSAHFAQTLGLQREGLLRSVEHDADGQLCDQVLLARLRTDPPPV